MCPDRLKRAVRSYILRSRRLDPAKARVFSAGWNLFGLSLQGGTRDFLAALPEASTRVLEIGFGMGDSLLEFARANPEAAVFGVEVYEPGIGHLMQIAGTEGLGNIRIYREDAMEVLRQCIPEASLARINLFFPDPWPKRRHHKRRLVRHAFLDLVSPRLVPGGLLHIATDWQPYAEKIADLLQERDDFQSAAVPSRPKTKYEQLGLRAGRPAIDLAFVRLP